MGKLLLGKYVKELINAILAGILLTLGTIAYVFCYANSFRILGAIIFSSMFILISLYGYSLVTDKMGYTLENKPIFLFDVIVSFFGNFIGTFVISWLISLTRFFDKGFSNYVSIYNDALSFIVLDKVEDGRLSLLVLGFLCGVMCYLTINTYKKAEQPIAKYLLVFMSVSLFVFVGLEHAVMDMALINLYALTNKFANYGTLIIKLIDVSFGNFIGCLFIPTVVFLRRKIRS